VTRTLWMESATATMLLVTTVFSYLHEQYATAVIAAVCTGLVGGMLITRLLYHWLEPW
jgi:hypothetical protein